MKHALVWYFGLALLACGQAIQPHDALESKHQARDAVTTVAAPLAISPSQEWEGNDGLWTSYNLRLGAPQAQNARVFPSTKATFVWAVDPQGCQPNWFPSNSSEDPTVKDCWENRGGVFDVNGSAGWMEESIFFLHIDGDLDEGLGYNTVQGLFGYDQVVLGYDGAGPTVAHQLIATVTYQYWWFGAFPLNPRQTNLSGINTGKDSLLQNLKNAGSIPSLSWGYTAGANYRSTNFYGSLILGGYDSARFKDGSQISVPFNTDDEKDLSLRVKAITTNVSSSPLSSETLDLVIDSTVPYLYLPQDLCQEFEKQFGLEWNATVGLYTINQTHYNRLVDQSAGISFEVGSQNTTTIHFPIKAFLLQASFPLIPDGQKSYYFPIKQANGTEHYTLGRAFLQEAYITYDYERRTFSIAPCVWPNDTAVAPSSTPVIIRSLNDTSEPTDSKNGTHSLSTGAIAGAAVGGVIAGLLLAALVACIWIRRRRRNQQRRAQSVKTSSSIAHTRSSSSATLGTNGRPRAGSRIASFFRNPWGSMSDGGAEPGLYELPVDPKGLTPAEREQAAREREHKRHLSNELDAAGSAVHEMYQPKPVVPEMQGDEPFPTYVSGDGATIDGNALRAAQDERERERERLEAQQRKAVYEMDATGGLSSASSLLPSPPMPSPGQIDAIARKEREERERLEAERAEAERVRGEELQRRVSDGNADTISSADGVSRPDTERRVSDLSPISENSGFARTPTSPSRPDAGSRRVSRD